MEQVGNLEDEQSSSIPEAEVYNVVVTVDLEERRIKTCSDRFRIQGEVGFGPASYWALNSRSGMDAPLHAVSVRDSGNHNF